MDPVHYHLVINHLPIIIPVVGLLVLVGGFAFRSEVVKRTAFFIFIIAALSNIAAFATGDAAAELLEHRAGFDQHLINIHEELAETFSVFIYILGVVSLVALWTNWTKKAYSGLLTWLIIGICLVVLLFAQKTGASGGIIRHTEIASGSALKQRNSDENRGD